MKLLSRIILILVCLAAIPLKAEAPWGFFAHKRINELAVFTLPTELFGFYKDNIHFITEHAVDPDKRRYGVKGEAPRHYIDIDHYCKHDSSCNPFDLVPRRWNDAVAKFSEDTLMEYGIVPWHISNMTYRLTKAFEEKNIKRILRTSAEIGHYIGDAHVPLHTTENYNGQMTGQYGIHGFWESRLPELYEPDYDFFVGKAKYVESPLDKAWDVVEASHTALDSVLRFEKELTEEFDEDDKFSYEERGRMIVKVYSAEFSNAYHLRLNGQVERRMKEAIITVGSLWYTAWVNAGQPNLDEISPEELKDLKEEIAKENQTKELPELRKREHDN